MLIERKNEWDTLHFAIYNFSPLRGVWVTFAWSVSVGHITLASIIGTIVFVPYIQVKPMTHWQQINAKDGIG